jgi:hypothetical protein
MYKFQRKFKKLQATYQSVEQDGVWKHFPVAKGDGAEDARS